MSRVINCYGKEDMVRTSMLKHYIKTGYVVSVLHIGGFHVLHS